MAAGGELQITYIGHATTLIRLDGFNIITDPIFSERAFISKRFVAPGLDFSDLPTIHCILVSHAHLDHLDRPTLRKFDKDIPIVIPARTRPLIKRLGFKRIFELSFWERVKIDEVEITAVPAKHFSRRWLVDFKRGYCGFIVQRNGKTLYFAGDTGYFPGFIEMGRRFLIDVALIPIGAYHPRVTLRHFHVNPMEAVKAFKDLGAKIMVPIHWGTFRISAEPIDAPLKWLENIIAAENLQKRIIILKHGESRCFD
ncbi:MAG: MBL fold metallo-hydrolase [Candidatus Tectomicrobia bacterium]|uniref:MBL fold metallo-hydrolase n=1 Tax=Tectimicrobiota bacterium TaxID=2528274 RepID=A0A933GMM5_UNCTE|nr:MBL fold metallo-hydrolase [Candidatus Tectomicrobia bacterium]